MMQKGKNVMVGRGPEGLPRKNPERLPNHMFLGEQVWQAGLLFLGDPDVRNDLKAPEDLMIQGGPMVPGGLKDLDDQRHPQLRVTRLHLAEVLPHLYVLGEILRLFLVIVRTHWFL